MAIRAPDGANKEILDSNVLYVGLMRESIWSSCFYCSCHKPKSKVLGCLHQNKSVAVGVFIDKLIMPHVMIMEAIHMHISYTNVG